MRTDIGLDGLPAPNGRPARTVRRGSHRSPCHPFAGSPLSLTALAHLPPRVFTSLSPAARLPSSTRVDSKPGNSREQSCAGGTAQWRGLRGTRPLAGSRAAVMSGRQSGESATARGRPRVKRAFAAGSPVGGMPGHVTRVGPKVRQILRILSRGARFPCVCALFRPQASPERGPPRSSPRRRAAPESSCGTPMHAASLTKGYGGNPPSGRSVSPPRTGPFYLGPPGGSNHRPEPFVPPRLAAHRRSGGRLRLRGLPHGQGPPAATTGPHTAACPILTEGLTIT